MEPEQLWVEVGDNSKWCWKEGQESDHRWPLGSSMGNEETLRGFALKKNHNCSAGGVADE